MLRSKFLRRLALAAALIAAPVPAFATAGQADANAVNIGAGTTQIFNGRGYLYCVTVITSPSTASTIGDVAGTTGSPGTPSASNAVGGFAASAAAGTQQCFPGGMPILNGLAITVGTSGVVSVSYSPSF